MQAFFFGKLPAHGDFVARGLTVDEQHRWDQGITAAMERGRAHFGPAFEPLYARAAPWRCLVRESEAAWLAGALALSIDRVGRLYPAFLAVRIGDDDRATGPMVAGACEDLLFEAINAGWTADTLLEQASTLPISEAVAGNSGLEGWWPDGHDLLAMPATPLSGVMPGELLIAMLAVAEQLS